MPNVFDITTPSGSVELSEQGTGSVAITVTNSILDETVRGRVVIKPLENTPAEWLVLDGAADQDFAPKKTQQFKVNIKIPQGTPEGTYSFRLDAFDVENPDEHFDEGQAIAFTVRVLQDVPQKKPIKIPWWAYVAAVVVVVGGFLLLDPLGWFGNGTVPDLSGMEYSDALDELYKKRFKAKMPQNRSTTNLKDVGKVLDQNPKPGEDATQDRKVDVWVGVYSGPKPPSLSIKDIRAYNPGQVYLKMVEQQKKKEK